MIKKIINIILSAVLILLPLIIFPLSMFPKTYNTPKIILLYICGFILFICLLIELIKDKKLKFDKIDKILLAFLILVGVSTIFSVNIKQSIFGASNRYEGLLTFICYYLVYYCAKYYFTFNMEFVRNSIFLVFITSIFAILQYYKAPIISDFFRTKSYATIASSTFGNRNFFASFVSILLPYTMCLYIFYHKKIYLFSASFCFYALLISLTRSAWIAFFVFSIIGIIYIIKLKNKKFFKNTVILLATFILCFLIFYFENPKALLGRYKTTVTDLTSISKTIEKSKSKAETKKNENSNEKTETQAENKENSKTKSNTTKKSNSDKPYVIGSGRSLIWISAFKIIKSKPLLGCGPDVYLEELKANHYEYLLNEIYYRLKVVPDKAHNEFLHIAATIGIPALIIYVTFIGITLKTLIKSNFKKNKPTFIVFLCLVSYLIQAFFNISTIGVAPIFYFLLGFSYKLTNPKKFDKNLQSPLLKK